MLKTEHTTQMEVYHSIFWQSRFWRIGTALGLVEGRRKTYAGKVWFRNLANNSNPGDTYQMKRRILLVDDEVAVLLTLKAVLEISGFDVDTATSAREGKARIRHREYEMVITDMRMEGERAGEEVIAEARAAAYKPAVALLTAFPIGESEWMDMGADKMLVKPMHTRALLQQLEQLFVKRQQELGELPLTAPTPKAPAPKSAAKRSATTRVPAKKSVKKVAAKKPVKKSVKKATPAKKTAKKVVKKAVAKQVAKKSPTKKKVVAKKSPVKKTVKKVATKKKR